jgi:hypothetical protein
MREQTKGIAPLIAAVQIEDIRLVEASVKTRIRSPQDVGEVDLVVDGSASIKEHNKDGSFVVLATIDAKLVPRRSHEDSAISIRAAFELQYSLPPKFSVSRRNLDAFAQINGVFNAWPYWREFVESMTARMHLPPLILPVFRVRETRKTTPKKASPARHKPTNAVADST